MIYICNMIENKIIKTELVKWKEMPEFHQEDLEPASQLLDKSYQDNYQSLDDLGSTKSKGPGPARNFAWAHSIANGHAWHWVMDDNIVSFYRANRNRQIRVDNGNKAKGLIYEKKGGAQKNNS